MAKSVLVTGLVLLALGAGCDNQKRTQPVQPAAAKATDGSVQVVNSMCPIGRHEWDGSRARPAALTREHRGTRIGFCCDDCVHEWDQMTAKERDQVRDLAMANQHQE
jgi:hypothetical protein